MCVKRWILGKRGEIISPKFKFLLLLILFINSCIGENIKEDDGIVKIEIDLESFNEGNLSDLYDSITYVLLKPDSSNFLADPYKIKFYKDLIFIRDAFHNSIFIYDKKGNLQFRINSTGKGPKEFFTMDDFSIYNDTIWIKDGLLKKELAYSLNGDLLLEKVSVFKRAMFHKGNTFNLYYLNNDPDFDYRIIRKSSQDVIPYILRPDYLVNNIFSDPLGFQSDKQLNVYFNLPNDYKILQFDSMGILAKQYSFDFGFQNFKYEDRIELGEIINHYEYAEENVLVESITSFVVLDEGHMIYLRRNEQNKEYIFFDRYFSYLYKGKNLINDLDFIPIVEMPWSSNGEEVIYLLNTSKFMSINNLEEIQKREGLKSNLNQFLFENSTYMEEENYIIAFAQMKKEFRFK
jgi:hypothetical protein